MATGKVPSIYVKEEAPWSAVRLDPGSRSGGETTIAVTYYDVVGAAGELVPFETFTLRRPLCD